MQSIFTPLPKTLLIHFELVAQKRDIEAIAIDTYGDFLRHEFKKNDFDKD